MDSSMSVRLILVLVVAGVLVIGLGLLIVWLCRQTKGAKSSLGEAKERQREMEQSMDSKQDSE